MEQVIHVEKGSENKSDEKETDERRQRKQHYRTSKRRIIAKPIEDMSIEELEAIVGENKPKPPKPPRSFND